MEPNEVKKTDIADELSVEDSAEMTIEDARQAGVTEVPAVAVVPDDATIDDVADTVTLDDSNDFDGSEELADGDVDGGDKPIEPEKPKPTPAADDDPNYKESDVFAFCNNLVQFKDELKIELFFFNRNNVVYRTNLAAELGKQLEPIFIDEILEYVLEGADNGLIVRSFEQAESEDNVLMRTRLDKVDKAREMLGWLKTQEAEIENFNEEEHDIKRVKGIVARCSHRGLPMKFYIIKALPQSQVMKGSTGWMLRDNKFVTFDADAALRVPTDNQLLVIDQDMYVFNQGKLKSLFGYDAKEASIAERKVEDIQRNFKLSFSDGENMQTMIKGNRSLVKKLQKIDPELVKQEDIMDRSDELDIGLMQDDIGQIIIMDTKDMTKFVNLLNDDYMESPMTGIRYEIQKKKELKITEEDENASTLRENI